jgi:hypothetical protein
VTEEDAGSWYLGKAKEEFHRRKLNRNAGQPKAEAEDPIEVKWNSPYIKFGALIRYFLVGEGTQKC